MNMNNEREVKKRIKEKDLQPFDCIEEVEPLEDELEVINRPIGETVPHDAIKW